MARTKILVPPEKQCGYTSVIVSYSTGIDSTGAIYWATQNFAPEKIFLLYCDTGAEYSVNISIHSFLAKSDADEPEEDSCKVRIIFAVYSENGQDGPLALLNLMLRVRSELKKAGAVGGGQFVLEMPLEYIVYQDTTPPYYMGEMVTNWSLPVVQRDVAAVLQNL